MIRRDPATDLTRVQVDGFEHVFDGVIQITVGQYDGWRLASQFECDAGDMLRGILHDASPRVDGACEGDVADLRVTTERLTHCNSGACHDVAYPLGQTGFGEQIHQHQGGERGGFGRFDDSGASRGERRGDPSYHGEHRKVPRHNMRSDSDGLQLVVGHKISAQRDGVALQLVRGACVIVQELGDGLGVLQGLG